MALSDLPTNTATHESAKQIFKDQDQESIANGAVAAKSIPAQVPIQLCNKDADETNQIINQLQEKKSELLRMNMFLQKQLIDNENVKIVTRKVLKL